MKQPAFGALLVGLIAACGGGDSNNKIKLPDASTVDGIGQCNPLTQAGCAAGEKCTWLVDAVMPQYVGHIGCAADGTKNVGDACTFGAAGATGYDDCKKGGVCSAFGSPGNAGTCKQMCDQQGGQPACDAQHVCVTYSRLFSTGDTTPAAAGVCDLACDPLQDNDFDGSNGALTGMSSAKRGTTCGSAANAGCYGYPSFGSPPATGWSCTGDVNSDATGTGLRHRVQCTDANSCTEAGTLYVNSCNQGYLPLLKESSFVSTAVCIALCKPQTCYTGNCGGATNTARLGAANDGCRETERVGNGGFNTTNDADGGEHCTHLWFFEIDDQGNFLESPTSDTVGFCYNHDVYYFDSNGNGTIEQADTRYPNCGNLGSGVGTGSGSDANTRFGAVNLGCVPSTFIPAAQGKVSEALVKARAQMDIPRALYRRTMTDTKPLNVH